MNKSDLDHAKNNVTPDQSVDDRTFYWEWFKHEENLFTNRGSFFLVAESMLYAGVATLRSVVRASTSSVLLVFYGLGIFITLIWIGVNVGHYRMTRKKIQAKLNELEPRRSEVSAGESIWLRSHFWMGIILPSGVLISWFLLLILLLIST